MTRLPRLPLVFGLALLGSLLFLAGCDNAAVSPDEEKEVLKKNSVSFFSIGTDEVHEGLATLRRATAPYHHVAAATEDGFVQIGPCADPPGHAGAIGIPYVKTSRVDLDINLEEPEVLFYEPQEDGELRLVGAEPVVPIEPWDEVHDEPPSLFGHEFHRNEEAGLYGLHMWVWLHNPEGIFAFAHPKVSCEFAE